MVAIILSNPEAPLELLEYRYHAGIDWANESYAVSILDATRKKVAEFSVPHSGQGIADLIDRLMRLVEGEPSAIAFSIEIPRGAIVEALVEQGFHGFSLNPKQLDRFRDRHTVPGAKDDRLDAFVLADSLRTDRHLFKRIDLEDPLIMQLREISRADDDITIDLGRLTNRLREQLHRFFPQALELSPAADDVWLWDLLEMANTPAKARRLRRTKVDRLLQAHRIRRINTDQVFEVLSAPDLSVAPGAVEAAARHITLLLPRLQLLHSQRQDCEATMKQLMEELPIDDSVGNKNEHRDVDIIRSLPGIGIRVAATMLAEANDDLRTRNYHALRAHGGAAPITRRSGTKLVVSMRTGCNHRLRDALYHAAHNNMMRDPRSKALYADLRGRGHSHGRALRTVADHLLRVLTAMLRNRTLYDPAARIPAEQEKKVA
jgi:transposase